MDRGRDDDRQPVHRGHRRPRPYDAEVPARGRREEERVEQHVGRAEIGGRPARHDERDRDRRVDLEVVRVIAFVGPRYTEMMSTSGITSATSTTHESSSKSRTNAQPAKTAAHSFAKFPARPQPGCAADERDEREHDARRGRPSARRQSGSAISTSSSVPGRTTIETSRIAGQRPSSRDAARR